MKNSPLITCICIVSILSAFIWLPLGAQTLNWAAGNYSTTVMSGAVTSTDITTDADGNVIAIGLCNADADMDPGTDTLFLPGGPGVFNYVQKLDSNGNLLWALPMQLELNDLATDNAGNIYVVGKTLAAVDADPGPGVLTLDGPGGAWVKISPAGTVISGFAVTATVSCEFDFVKTDGSGTAWIAGIFSGSGDFDPGAGVTSLATAAFINNQFVMKVSPAGSLGWAVCTEGTTGYVAPFAMALDGAGNVVVVGQTNNPNDIEFGTGTTTINPSTTGRQYVMKLDSSGSLVFASGLMLDPSSLQVSDLQMTSGSGFVITGFYAGTVDFDLGPGTVFLTSLSATAVFMARYDSSANIIWARGMEETDSWGKGLEVDAADNIYLTGYYYGNADLDFSAAGNYPVTATASADIFFAKYSSAGDFVWGASLPGDNGDQGVAICMDNYHHLLLAGNYSAGNDFDPGTGIASLTAGAGSSAFVASYVADSCDLFFTLDTLMGADCTSPTAFAEAIALGGTPPYTYAWSTLPVTSSAAATFTSGGLYTLTVSDSSGCLVSRQILVPSFLSFPGIDLTAHASSWGLRPIAGGELNLEGRNLGCTPQTGFLRLILDPRTSLALSVPTPSYAMGDTLVWNFTSLDYDAGGIYPAVFLTTDSSVVLGEHLCFDVSILPLAGDSLPANNHFVFCSDVVASLDPNYKEVFPAGECTQHFVTKGDELTYTIHFQNTGTAEALEVEVLDTLDGNLDLSTLRLLDHSHYVWTEIEDSHILRFHFDGIHLPDSSSDPIASQGWVTFGIHPLPGLPDGTIIHNGSAIFFDSNPAIITNTVFNTLTDSIPPCSVIAVDPSLPTGDRLLLYPNPARDMVFAEAPDRIMGIRVTNALGQEVYADPAAQGNRVVVDTGTWPAGLYFIRVQTTSGTLTGKMIVE